MKIAVTGATGFVGHHLVAELVQSGIEVIAVCRTVPAEARRVAGCRWVQQDIYLPNGNLAKNLGTPDLLIHLAWGGLPNYRSLRHFEIELPAQYRFLRACVEQGVPRIMVSGTCLEYGIQSGALSEDIPLFPVTPYGYAKAALLRQIEFLRSEFDFEFTWLRLFYLFGPGQAETSLLPLLSRAIAEGRPEFDLSAGKQLRDFIDVREAVRLVSRLAARSGGAGTVNICSGQPISVREFVEQQVGKLKSAIKLNFGAIPYADYEPMEFWGSRQKLDQMLALGG